MILEEGESAEKWINTIATYERTFKPWVQRVEKIIKRYRDERRVGGANSGLPRFNILWSNVQTALPAVFARLPKPDVSRRFRDNDPVGRVAALILERGLEYEIEHYPDYRAAMNNCVQDRFLGGRGVSWVRYEPHIKAVPGTPEDGFQITEDADEAEIAETQEELDYECAPVDYVYWKDFGHTVARTWEEVTAVWRKVYMGRPALVERFGEEIGMTIPLDTKPKETKESDSSTETQDYQAVIYEIWDKTTGKALWMSKSLAKIIDERDDPLGLENFWPCPRPLFATLTSDSLEPTPDFTLYQDQANALDTLCDRIDGLIRALQVKGVYDAAIPELARLFTEGANNSLIPVKNWQAFAEKQGLKGGIDLVDLVPIFQALNACYTAMEQQKSQVYEITGLSDIIRGQSDAAETATAQRIKGQYGSMRLKSMQQTVAQFATEILQIKAQIMCKLFQPETLIQIGDVQSLSPQDQALVPQAIELLKNEPMRSFRIEVAADSMVQMDEEAEKEARLEFLKATGMFLKEAFPIVQSSPEAAPLLVEMLKFGVTAFKVGKTIEGVFDESLDKLKQAAMQPKPPQPNPEMEKIQATLKAKGEELQIQDQFNERQAQRDMQMEQFKQQLQARQIAEQNQMEAARDQRAAQMEAQLEHMRMTIEANQAKSNEMLQLLLARMNNETKIEVAQIAADTTLQAAQQSAAETATEN